MKITDNDIIKALECKKEEIICAVADKTKATHFVYNEDALDLINRQKAEINRLNNELHGKVEYIHEQSDVIDEKKAEIERLQKRLDKEARVQYDLCGQIVDLKIAKSEAIKEFAERLKAETIVFVEYDEGGWGERVTAIKTMSIDALVKEMTEETP